MIYNHLMRKKSAEEFETLLRERNPLIESLTQYKTKRTSMWLRCRVCDHFWFSPPGDILYRGRGCPECAKKSRLKKIRESRLRLRISNDDYEKALLIKNPLIEMLTPYVTSKSRVMYRCRVCDHVWKTTPRSVMTGTGCPACSLCGYSANKPGYFYVINFGDFIKFGITNNKKRRLNEHFSQGGIRVEACVRFEDGNYPLELEREVKRRYGGKFVSKDRCPDGYTETLSVTLIDEIKSLLLKEKT